MREAARPVIVLLHAPDPDFVKEASKRGIFAQISDSDVEDWQSSIDIVLRRFAEYHDLEGASGRRALIERAKGILMERHSINEQDAFEMLREHSRTTNHRLIDLAAPSSTDITYSQTCADPGTHLTLNQRPRLRLAASAPRNVGPAWTSLRRGPSSRTSGVVTRSANTLP